MIVLDTSAAVELLLNLPLGARVRERLRDPDVSLHAPHLLALELLQVLRRRVLIGSTTVDEAVAVLDFLDELGMIYHDHQLLSRRVWTLRDNLTAYDAAYVALAELLDATLVTADARMAHASETRAKFDLIEP